MTMERIRILMYSERTEIRFSWFILFDKYDEVFWANTYDFAENMLTTYIFNIVFIDYRVVDKYKKIADLLYQCGLSTKIRVVDLPLLTDGSNQSSHDSKDTDAILKPKKEVMVFDDLVIDPNSAQVTFKGEEIELTEKEFDLLSCLAKNRGQVLSYDDIFELVWKDNGTHGDDVIKAHLHRLRKKLSITNREYIKNVRGKGYRFSK